MSEVPGTVTTRVEQTEAIIAALKDYERWAIEHAQTGEERMWARIFLREAVQVATRAVRP